MNVTLKPLTPIWTGDSSGVSQQLRITGLMGSLRWWFEGLVRAMGHYACDPTAREGCLHDARKKERDLCPACWLFGATGWSRRFRLTASGLHAEPWYVLANPPIARMHENWLTRLYKPDSKVLWGSWLELNFINHLAAQDEWTSSDAKNLLGLLLTVMTDHGALGAKAQNGYGAVRPKDPIGFDKGRVREFFDDLPGPIKRRGGNENNPKWFDLRQTIFLDFQIPNPGVYSRSAVRIPAGAKDAYGGAVLPIAYDIRYKSASKNYRTGAGQDIGLRPWLKQWLRNQEAGGEEIDDLVGSTARSPDRTASRVFVTHLFRESPQEKYRLRIWVHVPPDDGPGVRETGEQVVVFVKEHMFRDCTARVRTWSEIEKEIL